MFFRVLFFLVSFFLFVHIPAASAAGLLDNVNTTFQTAASSWMSRSQEYAKHLFFGLAGIEFVWSAIQLTLKKNDLGDLLASTALKILSLSFFFSLLIKAPDWLPLIIDSFSKAGAGVSGMSTPLSPSAILDKGVSLAAHLVQSLNQANSANLHVSILDPSGSAAALGNFVLFAIVIGLSGLLVMAGYGLVAIQLLVTLIESYIVLGGGMMMLGFSGSLWTLTFAEKFFGYAVSIGIKLFTIYLVIGAGDSFTNTLIQNIDALGHTPSMADYFAIAASSMTFGAIGFMVPGLAGSMMNGSPSLSMGNMAQAAGGIAGSGISSAAKIGATGLTGLSSAQSIYDKTMGALGGGNGGPGGIGGSMGSGTGSIGGSFGSNVGKIGGAGFEPGNADKHTLPGLGEPGPRPASGPGSASFGSGSGIRSTGNSDSIEDPRSGNPEGARKGDNWLDKQARNLDEMSRRMDRMPHSDGHTGGVSIRFNHAE